MNMGRFVKGHAALNSKKMVETRRVRGNYAWTDEAKEKARKSHLGKIQPWSSINAINLNKRLNKEKGGTKIEYTMHYILDTLRLNHVPQFEIKLSKRRTLVDWYIPELKICVFCDGCYWHGCKEHSQKDRWYHHEKDLGIDKELKQMGYIVFRFWEHELKGMNSLETKKTLRKFLKEYRDEKHIVPITV